MRFLSAVALLLTVMVGSCGAQEGSTPAMTWGNWVSIKGGEYREFYSPVPAKGARWFSDSQGKCYVQAVVPNASLESVPVPEWFSLEGMGVAPSMAGDTSMGWGRWAHMDGKWYREFCPPGPRPRGVRWFADEEGACFSQPVVPEPVLNPMEAPQWFSKDGMGVPPRSTVK
ncbi:hypothetical protein [Dethiosulfovibrio salsuginis]|uniref:Lipoprotein n=1 Tax=Dethiosulfovibrio salsuginis TaxID=561720 RepID=A0A1X7KZW1_9BACT|nr:hypothetical protein [Dethiosulfovibrio salsuginis]SMG47128.1 hypothetical protein SAMN06275492_14117 [Dethiosulfovibrio salsuginis]